MKLQSIHCKRILFYSVHDHHCAQYSNINDIFINRAKEITVPCADIAAAR